MNTIDLRSDTVTLPTPEMIEAMTNAQVGDDVYQEDTSINRLQDMAAELLDKEAGLYVPTGTMGNLIGVFTHCTRGDEAILGNLSHAFLLENGGISAFGGIGVNALPNLPDGTIDLEVLKNAMRTGNPYYPITRLVILENTHNRCGGAALTKDYTKQVAEIAHAKGASLHIDGARIFNAAAALNIPAADLVRPADSITFCISKALCGPVGSVLLGTKDFIDKARHIRKQIGGGMRQAGYVAAAGIVALQEMTERLTEDHERAKALSAGISQIAGLKVYAEPPIITNMVYIMLEEDVPFTAAEVIAKMKEKGIKIGPVGPRHFRLVTHYWITDEDIEKTLQAFREILN